MLFINPITMKKYIRNRHGEFVEKKKPNWNALIVALGYVSFVLGAGWSGAESTIYYTASIPVAHAAEKPELPAIMKKIAKCESGGTQLKANKVLVTNTNTNGSVDVGKWQINMNATQLKEMAVLGFNPLTEEGNEAYAIYLYEHRGTQPWNSSAKCWKR